MDSHGKCDLKIERDGKPDQWTCRWTLNDASTNVELNPGRTLDVSASRSKESPANYMLGTRNSNSNGLWTYVFDNDTSQSRCVRSEEVRQGENFLLNSLETASSNEMAIKFLIPVADGYVVKSDFLEQRFESKGLTVSSFTEPLQFVNGLSPYPESRFGGSPNLPQLLVLAIGAILLRNPQPESLPNLEAVVNHRLSFPWLNPSPLPRKRLGIIQSPASLLPARRRWEAAVSLGVDLVLVSSQPYVSGEKELFEEIFESYLEVDLSADTGLAQRIADALKSFAGSLDGIIAVKDNLLTSVAQAAELLGLFTSPSEVYASAGDKFFTRMKEPGVENTFLLQSAEDLEPITASLSEESFPLVVKPCRGDSGQCVAKVSSKNGLREAVKSALAYAVPRRALIEPYVQGPEVDVNLVLLDGEILFGGVCDNFPSQADTVDNNDSLYFAETKNLSPSRLPRVEQEMLVRHFHQTLTRLGFRSGVFHVEGRVRDSSMKYDVDESGRFDIHARAPNDGSKPSAFLHEVNARPPGFQCCAALLLCFGVDFWALQMLCAMKEWDRYRALANPILEGYRDNLSVENLHFPVTKETVNVAFPGLDTTTKRLHFMGDPMPQLQEYSFELDSQVVQCQVCINAGEVYGGKGWLWLTTYVVVSRKGRAEALAMSDLMAHKYRTAVQSLDSGNSASP
ncbi:hypothetical protein ACLMJK_001481 [Lecanora helva]